MEPLFRPSAVNSKHWEIGIPLGLTRGWYLLYVAIFATALAAGVAILILGKYARKSRVSDFIVPDKGLIKVLPLKPGRIREVDVAEGQRVAKDQPLAAIDVTVASEIGRTRDLLIEKSCHS